MKQSQLFTKALKEAPKDEESVNAILLTRAGFVHKEMAGVWSFLPLGLRVLRKIENIIRQEMEAIGGQEVQLAVLQPKDLWEKTGRWQGKLGQEIMYKLKQGDSDIGLGPTHEEMLTNIIKNYVFSYEDLPCYIFQTQTKFRKEARAKSGLLRGREFGMKDLYSFHTDEQDRAEYYEKVKKTYLKIFKRCGLFAIITEASGAGFTDGFTHEFQVLSDSGEDTIVYCSKFHFSQNKEISRLKAGDPCPKCRTKLLESASIEVGNIFPLGVKYAEALGAFYADKKGEKKPIVMGCYGIGTGRLMATIVETHYDEKGIIWPESVAPFLAHLMALSSSDSKMAEKIKKTGDKIYGDLLKAGVEVLYDDREGKSAGEKFADADLIGIPWRIVISERTISRNCAEIKKRNKKKADLVSEKKVVSFLVSNF